ncbi:methyltransferase domain-containing protein [Patescibacteria group bacterium]|nr:MAG: methyltransferase domain-containing protein [Patescibacteria group bacterium]
MEEIIPGRFLDPELILQEAAVAAGSLVADFGCGSGYFSIVAARRVGNSGKVYALDVLPSALDVVVSRAKMLELTNIETVRVNLEREKGSKLDEASVDWVFIKDMLFQNKKKAVILAEAHRILKPTGKAVVVEWQEQTGTVGPAAEIRIKEKELQKMVEKAGFTIENKIDAGDFHYGVIVRKQA